MPRDIVVRDNSAPEVAVPLIANLRVAGVSRRSLCDLSAPLDGEMVATAEKAQRCGYALFWKGEPCGVRVTGERRPYKKRQPIIDVVDTPFTRVYVGVDYSAETLRKDVEESLHRYAKQDAEITAAWHERAARAAEKKS